MRFAERYMAIHTRRSEILRDSGRITRNAGGFWNDYRQKSEELRITSPTGGLVDYQAGLFLMHVRNSATYRRAWGNDAGAWYASPVS